ncbi:MAG: methyltransferase domain-containing protein [Bacteroidales bacterium]|nr:methyltransferase domain-containing protein [Bacteroidales bacterium]
MFLHYKIESILPDDRVLEVGPGGSPYFRSDVFLELKFDDKKTSLAQRAFTEEIKTNKPVFYYEGGKFPFKDNEFDYVICSHVIEHVDDIKFFLSELTRVAIKGYIEIPTIYYDYIYNIPEHVNLVFYKNNKLLYLKKDKTALSEFKEVQKAFYKSLFNNYRIKYICVLFFQGFEWHNDIEITEASGIKDIVFNENEINEMLKYKFSDDPEFEITYKKEARGLKQILRKIHYKIGLIIK